MKTNVIDVFLRFSSLEGYRSNVALFAVGRRFYILPLRSSLAVRSTAYSSW